MFAIVIPVDELRQKFNLAEAEINAMWPQILQRAADKLIENLSTDFATKSSGGTGSDGIQWKADKQKSGNIGVDSGAMRRSLKSLPQGEGVEILFATAWARHFDKTRTLIPDPIPQAWLQQIETMAADAAEQALQEILDR